METIIKQFKMIDFFGMLLPGFVIALPLVYEFDLWHFLYDCFKDELSFLPKVVFLLILSYVIGMLVHEIGDILEKALWYNPLTNPRTYAAFFSCYIKEYIIKTEDFQRRSPSKPAPFCKKIGNMVLLFLTSVLSSTPMAFLLCAAFQNQNLYIFIFTFFLTTAVLYSFFFPTIIKLFAYIFGIDVSANDKNCVNLSNTVRCLCRSDAIMLYKHARIIETYGDSKNEKARIKNLFDGFCAMSRNLFVSISIIRLYCVFTNGRLSGLISNFLDNKINYSILCLILIILILRYGHYTYLKVKYIYEDLFRYSTQA